MTADRMRDAIATQPHRAGCQCPICSTAASTSPFDSIRNVTAEGREYWSARDLMPLLGYSVWRDFANAVQRARVACVNSGSEPLTHFAGARKVSASGPAAEDYHLSRYACYLVALNGDPRKDAIAAAQTYFVIKTRQAETAPPALSGKELLARAVLEANDTINALTAELEQAAPKAAAYDSFLDADGDYSVGTVAKMLGLSQNKLFAELRNRRVFIAKGPMRNTPYQQYMHHFVVKAKRYERRDGECGVAHTTYVQPSGIRFISEKVGQPVLQAVTG